MSKKAKNGGPTISPKHLGLNEDQIEKLVVPRYKLVAYESDLAEANDWLISFLPQMGIEQCDEHYVEAFSLVRRPEQSGRRY